MISLLRERDSLLKVSLLSLLQYSVAVGCRGLWCAAVLLLAKLQKRASSLFLKEPYKRDNILQKETYNLTRSCSSLFLFEEERGGSFLQKEPPLSSSKSPIKETIFCKKKL